MTTWSSVSRRGEGREREKREREVQRLNTSPKKYGALWSIKSMPTEVHTICFHTRDAVERDDSRLVFELPSHRLRTAAVKIALGSCEFPMVQWTIEEDWSRVWMNEGIRLAPGSNVLKMAVRSAQRVDPEDATVLGVPLRLNPIVSARRADCAVEFECKHPHHLWGSDGKACLCRCLRIGEATCASSLAPPRHLPPHRLSR